MTILELLGSLAPFIIVVSAVMWTMGMLTVSVEWDRG